MNNNIFKGAKFGDKFLCVNDEIALYLNINDCLYRLVTEHGHVFDCDNEGYCKTYGMETYGVLSRYHEPIDEKKLNIYAHCADSEYMKTIGKVPINHDYYLGFKAGYRSAFNNKANEE